MTRIASRVWRMMGRGRDKSREEKVSFSISGSGHIDPTADQTAAEIEAELVGKLATAIGPIVGDPKYGIASVSFYGQHTGTADLAAAPPADASATPAPDASATPAPDGQAPDASSAPPEAPDPGTPATVV